MAQQVIANIYGMNTNMWANPSQIGFPTQGISIFVPQSGSVSMYGIYLYGGIRALLEVGSPEYFTDKPFAQLATECNL